ncbi:hypothetical protein [Nocardia sp. Marseille-Q1738]
MTDEMPPLYVPDVYSTQWPQQLKLSRKIHDWLEIDAGDDKSLKTTIELTWDAFGKGVKESVPKAGSVPQVDMTNPKVRSSISNMFTSYVTVNDGLKRAFDALQQQDIKVKDKVEKSKISSETARGYVSKLISTLNTAAETPPPVDDMSESEHVMTYVTLGMEESLKIMTDAKSDQDKHANGIGDDTALTKDLEKRLAAMEAAQRNPGLTPPYVPPVSPTPPAGTEPPYADDSPFPPGLDGLDDGSGPDSLTPGGLDDSGLNGQSPGGLGNLGSTPGMTPGGMTPTTPPVQPAVSPMGSGSGLMDMLMQQAMMRNLADRDLDSRRAELDPDRFEDAVAPVTPQPVPPQSVTAQPATVQQSTTAPATHHGQPSGTTSSTQPTGAPARTPGADGSVLYTFPNGKTQKVSVLVAQALDAAFGNKSGTDAQKAYEKTSVKWSDKKQIGDRVDPYQLMTGDVATWDNGTAIVVVFGAEEGGAPDGGTLEVIVNGELKPFSALMTGDGGKVPEMPDFAEKFGQFAGFAHPKGIELTAPADGGAPPATPGSADQSANAAMPVVAAG